MVEGALFIGSVIVAITQAIRFLIPKVNGAITIGVAALVGLIVAWLDTEIGVSDISLAQGIMTGLAASGVVTVAGKINTGDSNTTERMVDR